MANAAYATEIYSHGSPVPFTDEPTINIGANQYQVTDVTRRLFSAYSLVEAFDDDNGSPLTIEKIDFFNGVVLVSETPVGNVVINGAFITTSSIGGTKEYSFELNGEVLDNTSFDKTNSNGGYRTRCYGLHDVSVSLSKYDDFARKFINHKLAREVVYIEIRPGGGTQAIRGWFIVENSSLSGDIGSLEEEALNFKPADIKSRQAGKSAVSFFLTN